VTLERLTETVETELAEYFHDEIDSAKFGDFRGKLAGLTAVTCKYFNTLVKELEEGLPGVGNDEDIEAEDGAAAQQVVAGASGGGSEGARGVAGGGRGSGRAAAGTVLSRIASGIGVVSTIISPAAGTAGTRTRGDTAAVLAAMAGRWQCVACTSANEDLTITACTACGAARDASA
jgi:hypothetical protein